MRAAFLNLCCSALPSPGPESSSEQLAPLERKLRCLEQEKLELSRKLQGMGAIRAWAGWVCPAAGQAPQHYGCPHTAEALQTPSDHRELEQLRKDTCTHEGSWGEGGGVLELGRALFPPPRAGWAWGRVAILPAQISQLRQNLSSRCVGVADQGSGLRRPQGLPEHPLPSVGT